MCCQDQTWVRACGIIHLCVVNSDGFIYRLSHCSGRVFPTVFMCIYLFHWFYSFSLFKYLIKLWFSWRYSEVESGKVVCQAMDFLKPYLFQTRGKERGGEGGRSRQWNVHLCAFGQLRSVTLCRQAAGIAHPFTSAVKYLFARSGRK